jgi:hypothetical protein
MTSYKMILICGSEQKEYTQAVSFKFTKERYTPYTQFSGVFIGSCEPKEVTEVIFYCNGKKIHSGIADSISCEKSAGAEIITVKSYGFTMLLGQNQSEPGIISAPDLGTIIGRNLPIKHLSYQSNTEKTNYVYINEKTTVWEAICVYAFKAYGTHPYIYSANTVACTAMSTGEYDYGGEEIVSAVKRQTLTNLISHAYTNDSDGNWAYSYTNEFAVNHGITKQKYYTRDKEWYYDLNAELKFKVQYADRARVCTTFKYVGYKKEDLLERATVSAGGIELNSSEIDKIVITGTEKGVFTEIGCYEDAYCGV